MNRPEGRDQARKAQAAAAKVVKAKGLKRPDVAERMRLNNPVHRPGVIDKIRAKMQGRTFLARGGNGKLTPQQQSLATALDLPMEFAIKTGPVKSQFVSLPPCYKVDIACPVTLLAIEVDGQSHARKKWKFLDRRKESVLAALGWSVLRFTNQQVDEDLTTVLAKIRSFMTSKLTSTTTTLLTE